MKSSVIDFSRPFGYFRALAIPFRINLPATLVNFFHYFVQMLIAPLTVLVTAYFIDTALLVFHEGLDSRVIVLPLVAVAGFRLYGYLVDPFVDLVNKRAEQRKWLFLNYPLVCRRAALNMKHLETGADRDLIERVHTGDQLTECWDNISRLVLCIGQLVGYGLILFTRVNFVGRNDVYEVVDVVEVGNGGGGTPVGFIMVGLSIAFIAVSGYLSKKEYELEQRLTRSERLMDGYADALTQRDTAHERTLFGFSRALNTRWHKVFTYVFTERFRFKRMSSLITGVMYITLIILLMYTYGLHQAPQTVYGAQDNDAGIFGMLDMSIGMSIASIGMIIGAAGALAEVIQRIGRVAHQRRYIREFNTYMEMGNDPGFTDVLAEDVPEFEALELRGVSFVYPGTEKYVLRDCSLRIEKGKRYALVGANGSGKTTLARLLLQMYDNYEGEILLNGRPLPEWPVREVKSMVAAVFQSFSRYDISLADNIEAGAGFVFGGSEVNAAIKTVGLLEAVAALPEGKDTLMGKVHLGGVELSGGQWQRIAIARIMVSRAQLKILDEPTAALDPTAEYEMYEQFNKISKNATTVFISHRLASAKLADEIFVLKEGAIAEQGSHDALMERGGLYAHMFESQRGWYV